MTTATIETLSVGDAFLDQDYALCIYLGYSREAVVEEDIGESVIHGDSYPIVHRQWSPNRLYLMFYKNTWSLQILQEGMVVRPINNAALSLMSRMAQGYVDKHDWQCCQDSSKKSEEDSPSQTWVEDLQTIRDSHLQKRQDCLQRMGSGDSRALLWESLV